MISTIVRTKVVSTTTTTTILPYKYYHCYNYYHQIVKRRLCIVQQIQKLYNHYNNNNNNNIRYQFLQLQHLQLQKQQIQLQQSSSYLKCMYFSSQQQHHHAYKNDDDTSDDNDDNNNNNSNNNKIASTSIRLSKLVAACVTNPSISRREAERLIRNGKVSISTIPTASSSRTGKSNKKSDNKSIVYTIPQQLIDVNEVNNETTTSFVLVNSKRYNIPYDLVDSLLESSVDSESSSSSLSIMRNNSLQPRVWIMNKNMGELVTENDPRQRPTVYDRIRRLNLLNTNNNTSKANTTNKHIITIGRLDYNTEGLLLLTTNGNYSRQMELPYNNIHRTYRVRVHGKITTNKIKQIQRGAIVPVPINKNNSNNTHLSNTAKTKQRLAAKNNTNSKRRNGSIGSSSSTSSSKPTIQMIKYKPMLVTIDNDNKSEDTVAVKRKRIRPSPTIDTRKTTINSTSTNQWVKVTCTEGKNRQIRNVFSGLGLTVTRLIRISYGDYQLQTIPPGAILEVPYKSFENQRNKGQLQFLNSNTNSSSSTTTTTSNNDNDNKSSTTGNNRIGRNRNDNTTSTRSRRNNTNNKNNNDDDSYRSPIQWIRNHH